MQFSIIEILTAIGALGLFMFGMKIMSEAIQKISGSRIRMTMESLASSRARGIFSGFVITSLIQSSSASTVLVIGFVNAGLLTLTESIGVIMGANIGTTITAWLISILGFKVNITVLTLPIIAFGFPMTFSKRNSIKSWGEFLIGFAVLFIGLNEPLGLY
jgi:phosphate:Na+ symporter